MMLIESVFLYFSFALLWLLPCSTVYQIFCNDLKHDRIFGLIMKDLVLEELLWATFQLISRLFVFLISVPTGFYHLRYMDHQYLVGITGVFSVLKSKTQYLMSNLAFDAVLFLIVALSLGYLHQNHLIDVSGVFGVLSCWKRIQMFKLGFYVMLFLAIAFANSRIGEAAGSLESTCTSRPYYELIYFTESNWHAHREIVDLDQQIGQRDVQSIAEIIGPYVIEGGGHNVRIQFLGEDQDILTNEWRRRTRDLYELGAFQGRIIEFYAFPNYMGWPDDVQKHVAVDRSRVDGATDWIDMNATENLQELEEDLIRLTGDIPDGSALLWCSAKGEQEQLEFIVQDGPMWNILIYATLKICVLPPDEM